MVQRWGHHGWRGRRHFAQKNYLGRFVADVTIPDGMHVSPNHKFVKIWRLRNEGSNDWPVGTVLEFVGGDKLTNIESVAVPSISNGKEIDIAVELTAPSQSGRYVGFWKLSDSDGCRFGQRVWVDIFVQPENQENQSIPENIDINVNNNNNNEMNENKTMELEEQPQKEEIQVPEIETTPEKPLTENGPMVENVIEMEPIEEEEEVQFSAEIKQLADMGFSDIELNKKLLEKYNNDMVQVVQQLLSM